MIYLALYLGFGIFLSELTLRVDRKAGKRPSKRQYLNLVLLWPLVLIIAFFIHK